MLPLLLACLRIARQESDLLVFNNFMLNVQLSVAVVKLYDLVIHHALVVVDLTLLLFKHISDVLFLDYERLVHTV